MTSDLTPQEPSGAESKKPSDQILRHEMQEALNALRRSLAWLFFSGLGTGLNIGMSVFLMGIVWTQAKGQLPDLTVDVLMAGAYAFGFILVVLGRSELFTEQTTLATLPVLQGKAGFPALARLWGVVYGTNLIGAFAMAAFIAWLGPALEVVEPAAFTHIAETMVKHSNAIILASGVLAGWMMGLLSWLVAAGRDTISQIFLAGLIAAAIGLGDLHHCIVGAIEVLSGVFVGKGATWAEFGLFLFWATLGNILGGAIFAAIVIYGHTREQGADMTSPES